MGEPVTAAKPRSYYDCVKCPAFCCSIYERVQVTLRDIRRLAKHFGVTEEVATTRFTKVWGKERVLRKKADPMFGVGAEYSLGKHFGLRLSWDRYLDVGTANTTGDIDSDVYALGIRMSTGWFR